MHLWTSWIPLLWILGTRSLCTVKVVINETSGGGALPITSDKTGGALPVSILVDGIGASPSSSSHLGKTCLFSACLEALPQSHAVAIPTVSPPVTLMPMQQKALESCPQKPRVQAVRLSPEKNNPHPRCAVVSSSGILAGQGCGAQIDDSDLIFRINRAPTAGFEADVGSRTDVHVMNEHFTNWYARAKEKTVGLGKMADMYGPLNASHRTWFFMDGHGDCPLNLAAWQCATEAKGRDLFSRRKWKSLCIPGSLTASLYRVALRHNGKWPTTGLIGVMLASFICREVTVYGMMDGGRPSSSYSYFARSQQGWRTMKQPAAEAVRNMPWHNFTAEKELVRQWARTGLGLESQVLSKDDGLCITKDWCLPG